MERERPAERTTRMGEVVAGRYRIERQLARGGSSVLYAARHVRTGRVVALKLLRRELSSAIARKRFEREAQAALSIAHPHVVEVLDRDEAAGGEPFIAMELLQGRNLHALLDAEGPLPAARALELLAPIFGAVAVAHDAGVLHRDLKPANIFVVERRGCADVPKLLDFGIARLADLPLLTAPGRAVGTPGFMAPEQLRGAEQSAATDVWALGAVLYVCLMGRAPFSDAQLLEPRTPPLDRTGALEPGALALMDVIERALEWRRQDRPTSVRAFARAVLAAALRAGVSLPTAPDPIGLPDWTLWLSDAASDDPTQQRPLEGAETAAVHALLAEDSGERLSQPELGTRLAGRFEVVRRIGAGTMGTVLEAIDHTTGERIALKLLHRVEPTAIYRLKQEFRSLSRVSHPSLAALHELFEVGGRYFFTMELLHGTTLLDFLRRDEAGRLDVPRVVRVFAQLASALAHLHARRILHRDLKPSNVLVEPNGRVVIVDFGLAQSFAADAAMTVTEHDFVGTPAYAAPEQVDPDRVGPASDGYAVGAMLYEALCGARPFAGGSHRMMIDKATREPEPPSRRTTYAVPRALEELCLRLLDRAPERRPSDTELIAALAALGAPSDGDAQGEEVDAAQFSGRSAELERLMDAFARARAGELAALFVTGPSGIGKTSLARAFLARAKLAGAQVLESRCHAQEAVHYNAFDGAIDALSNLLRRASEGEPLPQGVNELAHAFPVLRRVSGIGAGEASPPALDDVEVRARTFAALRKLLAWSAARAPIILFIDDLHWGDLDSACLLRELLFGAPIPGVLILASYRAEPHAPMLAELFRDSAALARCEHVEIGPLAHDVIAGMVRGALAGSDEAMATSIADIAQGHPMFAIELIRFAREQGASEAASASLQAALHARLARSSSAARELLEIACVAAQPLPRSIAFAIASDSVQSAASASLRELRLGRLMRESARHDEPHLEPYHDQVRQAVVAALSHDRRVGLHGALADSFAARDAQLERAVHHYMLAGLAAKAAPLAARAGALATEALAFDRAVDLLTIAAEHSHHEADRQACRVALAKACARAGRTLEAAQHYERAGGEATGSDRAQLQQSAMAQYFLSGHVDRGIVFLPEVTDHLDVPRFPSRWSMLRSVTVALSLILLGYPRLRAPAKPATPEARALATRLWLIASALTHVRGDTAMAMHFARLALFHAARHGIGTVYGQTTAMFMLGLAFVLCRPNRRLDRRLATAEAIVARDGDEAGVRFMRAIRSACDLCASRNHEAFEVAHPIAVRGHVDSDSAVATRALARNVVLAALYWMGRLRELAPLCERWIEDAHNAGDRYLEMTFRIMGVHRFLRADDVPAARRELAAAHALRIEDPERGMADPWWEGQVELYDGRPERALALCEALRARFQSFSSLAGTHRALFAHCEGSAYAASITHGQNGTSRARALAGLARAERIARGTSARIGKPIALQLSATGAMLRGQHLEALGMLRGAVAELDALGMRIHAASCRVAMAHVPALDANVRAALLRQACGVLEAEGIASPMRWARTLVPGFF